MRPLSKQVNAIAFGPSESGLVYTGAGKRIGIWLLQRGVRTRELKLQGEVGTGNGVSVSMDGTLLASCGNDKKVTVWGLPEGGELKHFELDGWVRSVALWMPTSALWMPTQGATRCSRPIGFAIGVHPLQRFFPPARRCALPSSRRTRRC